MITHDAAARRKVRRAAKDEIKSFVDAQDAGFTEIAFANFVATFHAVPECGFPRAS